MFDLKTRVLVVDDMATMRRIVMKACSDIGFTDVVEAPDGESAWNVINSSKPPIGLVLSDWMMPKLTGPELIKRVRADARYKDTPIILVTSENESKQIMKAAQSGMDEYIVKPFNSEMLITKLVKVYEKRNSK